MADASIGAEWFDALQHAADTNCEEVPEGWMTVREIAAQTGMSEGIHGSAYVRQSKPARFVEGSS